MDNSTYSLPSSPAFVSLFFNRFLGTGSATEQKEETEAEKQEISFLAKLKKEKDITIRGKNYVVVDGDIVITKELFDEKYKAVNDGLKELERTTQLRIHVGLLGMVDPRLGVPVRWAPDIARKLTYYINAPSFKDQNPDAALVARLMDLATKSWSNICGVFFQEVSTEDESIFVVSYRNDVYIEGLMASAFFPDDLPENRVLWIYKDFSRTGYSMVGILRHELGHILGFRHEHIRLAAYDNEETGGNRFEITPYDRNSVMHYVVPEGGSREGKLSKLDIEGAVFYYGVALNTFSERTKFY